MTLLRNIALMGTSTAMRLGFGTLTFVVMARMLGPEQFGMLMLWLSAATLLSLLANYGLTPYLLREIGAKKEQALQIMADVLSAKLLLSSVVLLVAVFCTPWLKPDGRAVFMLMLGAQLADSLTEFFNVGYRATNRFGDEARIASVAVILQCAVVTLALWWLASPLVAAGAFFVSRIVVLALTWVAQRRYFAALRPTGISAAWIRIWVTKAYAIDFGLQNLLGQLDSIVINHFVGPSAVGIYQAGMRLFNGGAQAAGVLANVFLPRAAAVTDKKEEFRQESTRIQWAFVTVGLFFGLGLAVLAKPLVNTLFGEQYAELASVLPWFGLLFFVRFFASSWGVLLTSAGAQYYRAVMNALQWVVVALLSLILVPRYGLTGWLVCLITGNSILALAYIWRGRCLSNVGWRQPAFVALLAMTFMPFLRMPLP